MSFIISLAIITILTVFAHFFIGSYLNNKIRSAKTIQLENLAPWSFSNLISSSISGLGLALILFNMVLMMGTAINNVESPKNFILIGLTLFFGSVALWLSVESSRQFFIYQKIVRLTGNKTYRLDIKNQEIQINSISIPFSEIDELYWSHTQKNHKDFRTDLDHGFIVLGNNIFFISALLVDITGLVQQLPEEKITVHKSHFQHMPKNFGRRTKEIF